MKSRITAKKACKYLKLDSKLKIPICTIEPVICTYWFCDAKGFHTKNMKCNLDCFRKCAIKNPRASIVADIEKIYDETIERADTRLEHYRKTMPPEELVGGLLAYRELEILRGFFESPGSFIDVFQIQDLIPDDISFLKQKDIVVKADFHYFLHLFVIRNVLNMERYRINKGSLLIYATPEGLSELKQKMIDPENDELLKWTKNGKENITEFLKKGECHNIMRFEPIKNHNIIEWCKSNNFEREILEFSNTRYLKKIYRHLEDAGKTGRIDVRECYDLSYQPYMNSIYALRNIYSHSRKFLRIAKTYKDLWQKSENIFSWLPVWDNSMFVIAEKARKEDFLIDRFEVDNSPEYSMHIDSKTLFGSLLLWSFVGKNWNEVCATQWTKGQIFEDKVEKELYERDVTIIDKNIQLTPDDEIDFLCKYDSRYFMIEAKNYGPNWDYNFLSSNRYEERIIGLNSRIRLAPRRLDMIKSKRDRFGIPANAKIIGVIITSFIEPHIEVPEGFVCINVDRISRVFGKKLKIPNWRKAPVFQFPNENITEIHKRRI